ncbi:MAG TPA: serine hydrolase [Vicinamibacteria bacterium]|nr:serine hydrolase [Vicinamibacteria bacterium]
MIASALAVLLLLSGALEGAEPRALNAKDGALLAKLEARIDAIDRGFDGVLGLAIQDAASGRAILRNADEVFPAASVIKIAVLAELFRQDQQARECGARLLDPYVADAGDAIPGSAMLQGMTTGVTRLTNRDLATFMMGVSDNGATNVLIERVGPDNVNALLEGLGLKETRLRRRMLDVAAARQGRENTATPRELVSLLDAIRRGAVLDAAHTEAFLAALATASHQAPMDSFLRLPEDVRHATKTGFLEGVRAEAGIVFATNRPFVIAVMTGLAGNERAAEDVIGDIGAASLETFERLGRSTPLGRVLHPRGGESP